ncbi:MAG: hypothetical protein FWG11_00510 [Promicromonosporaceae bacterium]|nr:hypothetical protein [Promicromonosporaceae bacterium]
MLGRTSRESPVHAAAAARSGAWSALPPGDGDELIEIDELLDLGSTRQTLATVAAVDDLAAVVHLGHPEQPAELLEASLLSADHSLGVVAAQPVAAEWTLVARPGASGLSVTVDEAGLRDCGEILRSGGLLPQVVPGRMSAAQRLQVAGPDGSLLLESSRVPAGLVELPFSAQLKALPPIWFGLLGSRQAPPAFAQTSQVWLALGPSDDRRGSLRSTLTIFADTGLDLQHLRSHPASGGPHVFFSSFSCPGSGVLATLVAELDAANIANRVLAVLPGENFLPGPKGLEARWTP